MTNPVEGLTLLGLDTWPCETKNVFTNLSNQARRRPAAPTPTPCPRLVAPQSSRPHHPTCFSPLRAVAASRVQRKPRSVESYETETAAVSAQLVKLGSEGLLPVEFVAIRLYTGPLYIKCASSLPHTALAPLHPHHLATLPTHPAFPPARPLRPAPPRSQVQCGAALQVRRAFPAEAVR